MSPDGALYDVLRAGRQLRTMRWRLMSGVALLGMFPCLHAYAVADWAHAIARLGEVPWTIAVLLLGGVWIGERRLAGEQRRLLRARGGP